MSEVRNSLNAAVDETDLALADWVAELVERLEAGEPVDMSAVAAAHPERAEELGRVLPTIRRMVSFGRSVARSTMDVKSAIPTSSESELGTLGDFRLLREVGRGGMGMVFEAEQISLQRRVALKILPLAAALDPRHHQRFLLEARAAACLHHTHIVPVHAVGCERGVPYYAMQFIDGCTLAEVLEQLRGEQKDVDVMPSGTMSLGTSSRDRNYIRAVADQGRRAAEALDHAHSRGVLHRDIKPANLMLDGEGHLWITDFGLAQIQGDSRLTMTGDILGTLRYMSPEQALAKRVVIDGRTDIYSLGATLYELLALRPVFEGADRVEVLAKIAQCEPMPLRKLNPAVPQDLETIVHKTLSKEPGDRYATAHELADDLGRFLNARPIVARPPGWFEQLHKWTKRNRAVVFPSLVFVGLAFGALAGGLIWSNDWLGRHNDQLLLERDRAERLSDQLKDQRDLAEQRRRVAAYHLYDFRIRQAAEAVRVRRFEKAQEILRDCRPAAGEDDPREFAWQYLWRESRKEIAAMSERGEMVSTIALSPDGKVFATGNREGTIRLRNAETGNVITSLKGRPIPITVLAFSPDSKWLASGATTNGSHDRHHSEESELLLWDVATGRQLAQFEGIEGRHPCEIEFSASGREIWERSALPIQNETSLWTLDGPSKDPRPCLVGRWNGRPALAASAASNRVVVLEDSDQVATVVDGNTGRIIVRSPRASKYESVAISRDGKLLAMAAYEGISKHQAELSILDVDSGKLILKGIPGPWRWVREMKFSANGKTLFAISGQGVLQYVDAASGETWTIDREFPDEGFATAELAFLAGGRSVALAYFGDRTGARTTRIYYAGPGGKLRTELPGLVDMQRDMIGFPDDRSLGMIVGDRALVWHYDAVQRDPQSAGHRDEAWSVDYSSDGQLLVSGSDDSDEPETLKLWDAATGQLVRGWKAHTATTSAVRFQPGGKIVASAALSANENLRLWDSKTGALLATLDGHTDRLRAIVFSPDGTLLASAGSDRMIRLWDVASRRCIREWSAHFETIRQLAFSPDGRTLASAANDFTVRLWDTNSGEMLNSWTGTDRIAGVAYSADGGVLSWVQEDGIIQRRDLRNGRPLEPLHSEYDELRCLAFSPNGRTLAAAGKSGKIHIWDAISGQELLIIDGRPCQVNSLVFSPDGTSLAACWHDGTVRQICTR